MDSIGAYSHEADDGNNFDDGEYELSLTIALDSAQVDGNDSQEIYGDENGLVQMRGPVGGGDGCRYDFERKGNDPLQGITSWHN